MRRWDALVDSYISICQARGVGKSHAFNNERELQRLGIHLKSHRPKLSLEEIKSEHLLNYIQKHSAFKSKATVYGSISRVRCFGEFLVGEGIWTSNPLRWVQGPKLNNHRSISKTLNKSDIAKIYVQCFKNFQSYFNFLTPAVFSILYTTGMRRGELIQLNVEDWNSAEHTIKIKSSKTDIERFVPVQDVTARLIETYLCKRTQILIKSSREDEKALFVTTEGKRVNANNLSSKFKEIAIKADVKVFSLHMLRHSCATDLIAAGVGIPQVQRVLGHACMQTTMRYTHVSDPQRTEAIKAHPINQILGVSNE